MKGRALSKACCTVIPSNNTSSLHSATILNHTIASLHNLYSSQKQNTVSPSMRSKTNLQNIFFFLSGVKKDIFISKKILLGKAAI